MAQKGEPALDLKYIGMLVLLVSAPAAAETAYVTDNLRLGLHKAIDTSDRSFRTLDSGQELEVLDRNRNYAHVVLPDGAQGYVKAAYLVSDKPAKLIVAETEAKVLKLQDELLATKEAFAAPAATIASLEQDLMQSKAELGVMNASVNELLESNEKYKKRHEQFKYSLPLFWVAAAMTTTLLVGFLAALFWVDRQSRKRHGGLRIF